MLQNCGHSMKWKELAVNRTLLAVIKIRANTFFAIVRRKVLRAAEVFATTGKRWSQGRKINLKIALSIWQPPWAFRFLKDKKIQKIVKLWKFYKKQHFYW